MGHREVPDTGRRFWGPLILPALLACILAAMGLVAWLPDGRWWWVVARLAAVVVVLVLGAVAVHRIETRTLTGRRRRPRLPE